MEHNFRLNAQNQILNTNSKQILLQAVVSEQLSLIEVAGGRNAQQGANQFTQQRMQLG
jgi:hypothetical protein